MRGPCAVSAISATGSASAPSPSPCSCRQRSTASRASQIADPMRRRLACAARLAMIRLRAVGEPVSAVERSRARHRAGSILREGGRGRGTARRARRARRAPRAFQRGGGEGAARTCQRIRAELRSRAASSRTRNSGTPCFSAARLSRREAVKSSALRIAGDLADHAGELAAAQPFLEREQRILGLGGGDMDQPAAQLGRQPGPIGPPGEPQRGARPAPTARLRSVLPSGQARVERQRQRRRRAAGLAAARRRSRCGSAHASPGRQRARGARGGSAPRSWARRTRSMANRLLCSPYVPSVRDSQRAPQLDRSPRRSHAHIEGTDHEYAEDHADELKANSGRRCRQLASCPARRDLDTPLPMAAQLDKRRQRDLVLRPGHARIAGQTWTSDLHGP